MPTTATLTLIGATLAATAEVEPTLIAEGDDIWKTLEPSTTS